MLFSETIQVSSTSVSRLDEDACSSDGTDDWDTLPTRSVFHLPSFHIKVENWGEHFDCPVCVHMCGCVFLLTKCISLSLCHLIVQLRSLNCCSSGGW